MRVTISGAHGTSKSTLGFELLIAGVLLTAVGPASRAQEPQYVVGTTAVLAAVARAWTSDDSATTSDRPRDMWYARSDDSLTRRFAAAIKQRVSAPPRRLVCPSNKPQEADTGLRVEVLLRVVTSERVIFYVTTSCPLPPTARGFWQVELFEALRRDGAWTARYAGSAVS